MTTCCSNPAAPPKPQPDTRVWIGGTAAFVAVWFLVYGQLKPAADAVTALFPVEPGSHAADALAFFVYDTPKVLMLLTRQLEILKVRERINSQVQEEMGHSQREYVLRQ